MLQHHLQAFVYKLFLRRSQVHAVQVLPPFVDLFRQVYLDGAHIGTRVAERTGGDIPGILFRGAQHAQVDANGTRDEIRVGIKNGRDMDGACTILFVTGFLALMANHWESMWDSVAVILTILYNIINIAIMAYCFYKNNE